MIGILVVTLGTVAKSFIDASQHIIGKSNVLDYFCVDWRDEVEAASARLGQRIVKMNQGDGVLLLTDIFGGTATNIALRHEVPGQVEVVTGVNLTMVVRARTLPSGLDVVSAADLLAEHARKAITNARQRI